MRDAFRPEGDGALEAEGERRAVEVVVDRLRHPDHAQAPLMQALRDGERAVTADGDQGIQSLATEGGEQIGRAVDLAYGAVGLGQRAAERVAARRKATASCPGRLEMLCSA